MRDDSARAGVHLDKVEARARLCVERSAEGHRPQRVEADASPNRQWTIFRMARIECGSARPSYDLAAVKGTTLEFATGVSAFPAAPVQR